MGFFLFIQNIQRNLKIHSGNQKSKKMGLFLDARATGLW